MKLNPLKAPHRHEEAQEDWLLTFADMVVILMCFFIMLFALSYVPDKTKGDFFESLRESGFESRSDAEENSFELLSKSVFGLNKQFDSSLIVLNNNGNIDIELGASAFFASGSAQFKPSAVPVLTAIASKIVPFFAAGGQIRVAGHTDDYPIATEQFPSNWELSAARASNVVRFLIAKGAPPDKLVALGYADTKPKAENHDASGVPIPANKELNRRVVITITRAGDGGN